MELAPILLFVYNRPHHTKQTLDALAGNELASSSRLYVMADGPKENSTEKDLENIRATRTIFSNNNLYGFRDLIFTASDINLGLSESVIRGVNSVLSNHESVIILEDDIVTGKGFLKFMNEALALYENDDDVISIHGYNYPINPRNLGDSFFLKGADCWGWATWSRGWTLFENDPVNLYQRIINNNLQYEFDFFGSYPYTEMLKQHIEKKNNSWAILWYASAFLKNKYTLYPAVSLVKNIGLDGSGTHGTGNTDLSTYFTDYCKIQRISVKQNNRAISRIREFHSPTKLNTFIKKLASKLNVH